MRAQPVGAGDREQADRDHRGDRREDEDAQLHAGEEQRAQHDQHEHHRGAEVAGPPEPCAITAMVDRHHRDVDVPPQPEQGLLAVQDVAEPQRESEFEELGGLRLDAGDHDPVAVSVRLDAEAGVNTSSWKIVAKMSAGHATRFQNAIGSRLAMNISGMPITANTACLVTASYGGSPAAVAVADVADSTITSPKPVSRSAVDAISRNSLGTGANTLPSETRAARPRAAAGGQAPSAEEGSAAGSSSPSVPRSDPIPHGRREATTPVGVGGELVEGCRGGGEQNDVPVTRDSRPPVRRPAP